MVFRIFKRKHKANREASCSGKKQYSSYALADSEMRYLRRKLDNKDPMRVYHCTYCNAFHIGTEFK